MMPKQYQNVGFEANKAIFSDVNTNTAGPNTLVFANADKNAPIAGGARVKMVSGHLTVNQPFEAGEAGSETVLNESVKLQWNVRYRGSLVALRAELNRVLDEAIADHNLTSGLVPPVFATFAEE